MVTKRGESRTKAGRTNKYQSERGVGRGGHLHLQQELRMLLVLRHCSHLQQGKQRERETSGHNVPGEKHNYKANESMHPVRHGPSAAMQHTHDMQGQLEKEHGEQQQQQP